MQVQREKNADKSAKENIHKMIGDLEALVKHLETV